MKKEYMMRLKPLSLVIEENDAIYMGEDYYIENKRININRKMQYKFGHFIIVYMYEDNVYNGYIDKDGWIYLREWFENEHSVYIDKLFDDLLKDI